MKLIKSKFSVQTTLGKKICRFYALDTLWAAYGLAFSDAFMCLLHDHTLVFYQPQIEFLEAEYVLFHFSSSQTHRSHLRGPFSPTRKDAKLHVIYALIRDGYRHYNGAVKVFIN